MHTHLAALLNPVCHNNLQVCDGREAARVFVFSVNLAWFSLAPASCLLLSCPVGNFRRTLSVFGSAVFEPGRVHMKTGERFQGAG